MIANELVSCQSISRAAFPALFTLSKLSTSPNSHSFSRIQRGLSYFHIFTLHLSAQLPKLPILRSIYRTNPHFSFFKKMSAFNFATCTVWPWNIAASLVKFSVYRTQKLRSLWELMLKQRYFQVVVCELMFFLLEYFKTVAFGWMFLEGFYLHNQLVLTVFNSEPRLSNYCLAGYGNSFLYWKHRSQTYHYQVQSIGILNVESGENCFAGKLGIDFYG